MTSELNLTMPLRVANDTANEFNTKQHFLAPYATFVEKSRGRLIKEEESNTRSAFRRDCDRIIHSTAFRRLEYKTQVFVNHEGDHYRTRLTHTLEVAQIARSISRSLGLCEDLSEALALSHDLGHAPFGHAGEEVLQELCKKTCKFDHNAQSLKLLTELEHKYAAFDGLNLSWEVIDGVVKHNGPLIGKNRNKERYNGNVPRAIAEYNAKQDLELDKFSSAEAQIASYADDIAYNNHDIDDGLRAQLFSIEDLKKLPMIGNMFRELENEFPGLASDRLINEASRRIINRMIVDLTRQTALNIKEFNIKTVEDIRNLNQPVVTFSKTMEANVRTMKEFLRENMYRHYKVCRMTSKARRIVSDLFEKLHKEPECLPSIWREKTIGADDKIRAEIVVDYISGMTDRFAIEEHKRLFDIEWT
ncbi:deoxyguanosinetriphosphate triphosphohydrolase [Rickettsiales bacterium]|nr:deoxyguanosinetriphosphate triphosphohydrolase [Rickettsiales bacterium]